MRRLTQRVYAFFEERLPGRSDTFFIRLGMVGIGGILTCLWSQYDWN